ncbi:MAG: CBS domain-containing protein [Methanomicrobiales archaeon]|nr:CBS domain-containing protein [Methanomicrobiales archaeon]
MEGSVQIGTLFGIPIRLHFTFLLVIPLFAWIIGSQIELTTELLADIFGVGFAGLDTSLIASGYNPYLLGTIVAIGLFAGVLLHELAHSLIARSKGMKINSITLLILGGVASMEEGIPDPMVELPMALAGPVTSLVIGICSSAIALFAEAALADRAVAGVVFFVFGYLGLLNVILFAFNLLPAFPMDGGRVLRAWLAKKMPLHRATKIAADIGRAFAVIFGIFGFFVGNVILIIIAFFIYIGAGQESLMVKYNYLLQDVSIADAMSSPVVTVPPTLPVEEAIDMMYQTRHLGFPVEESGVLVGMITLSDVHAIQPPDREAMQVRDIMTKNPLTLPPTAPLTDALKLMSARSIGRIPVVRDGRLVGIVTRTDILRVMELKEA